MEAGRRPEDPDYLPTHALERLGVRFYFDTNFVGDDSAAAKRLRELHREGWIGLLRTDTVDTELDAASDPDKRAALLEASSEFIESLGPVVLDHSRLDFSVLGSDEDEARLDRVYRILFPDSDRSDTSAGRSRRKMRDAMHVATALRYGAGMNGGFITRDEDIVSKAAHLAAAFNDFRVFTPEQALVFAERMRGRYLHRMATASARVRERAVVCAAGEAVAHSWGHRVLGIEFPEDQRPAPERPIDALLATDGTTIAIEHTLYLSFAGEIEDGIRISDTLGELVERLTGTLPTPGRYELGVPIGAVAGHDKTDLTTLEAWIRTSAPTLALGRSHRGSHFVAAQPPDVPFPVTLMRWEPFEGEPDGTLIIRRPIDLDELAAMNVEQTAIALARKLPKLEEHRPAGGRTLLVFEEPGIELVNVDSATRAVRSALAATPGMPAPDAVVLVYTISDPWLLMWIKDGDAWNPDLDRSILHLEAAPEC